jgi:D-sedoheptulose 7-phosphate isomerase
MHCFAMPDSYSARYLREVSLLAERLGSGGIEALVDVLVALRDRGGRLFVIGVGGGAGNASHAVNDFRKLCAIDALCPLDNVSELTARINDDGWEQALVGSLRTSRLSPRDVLLVFSVGGGSREKQLSLNIVAAVEYAKQIGAQVLGVVGRADGTTAQLGDCVVLLDRAPPDLLTPLVEGFQAIIWHALVSHPRLSVAPSTWESVLSGRQKAAAGDVS